MIRFGSLFSGIGGFDLGFERAGMECAWQIEIDKHCQKLLAGKFPGARRYEDVRSVGAGNLEPVDLICGGFPCQDVSIAGNRAGLAGARSGLWFEYHRILQELKPHWVVIENVPGLLSSHRGRDFAAVLQGLAECGYYATWRVLDSQYFGLAQRRKRVFVVASLGNGSCADVLFEREGVYGDTAAGRKPGEEIAHAVARGSGSGYRYNANGEDFVITGMLSTKRGGQANETSFVVPVAYTIQQNDVGAHRRKDRLNGGMYVKETDTALTVGTTDQTVMVWEMSHADEAVRVGGDIAPTLQQRMGTGGNQVPLVGVRRLTPTECERLQGFPDGWTGGQSDSVRYRQLGNAVSVPVAEWIGKRIVRMEGEQHG